jgi:hypothetical protein
MHSPGHFKSTQAAGALMPCLRNRVNFTPGPVREGRIAVEKAGNAATFRDTTITEFATVPEDK